jgi:predicted TIM-barrel enzyme
MNRINEVFGRPRVLLPVIHPVTRDHALAAVDVAVAAGADGVFLINQGLDERAVLALIGEVRGRYPSLWVGVNLLSRAPADALAFGLAECGRIDGIWSDNAGIDERGGDQARANAFVEARQRLGWNGLYFGGVAFKYQREVARADLARAAAVAAKYMDVICTSGPGTGRAADPAKPRAMREGASGVALALASGVTTANVGEYLPYVDAYLVGTGIERELGVLDPDETKRLAASIHAFAA